MRDVQASFASAEAAKTPSERIERLVRSAFEILDANRDFWRRATGFACSRPSWPDSASGCARGR